MKPQKLLLVIMFAFVTTQVFTQDKVNMLNGKVLEGEVISTSDEQIVLKMTSKKGKVYDTYLENYRVFSILNKDGKETIIYKQDTSIGNFLAEPDMQKYMLGERDADLKYKPLGTMILGAGLSLAFSLFDTYSFKSDTTTGLQKGFFRTDPSLIHIGFPIAFTVGSHLVRTQLDIKNVSDMNLLSSEHYIQGFGRIARFKRSMRALVFSFGGSLLGLGMYYIFKP